MTDLTLPSLFRRSAPECWMNQPISTEAQARIDVALAIAQRPIKVERGIPIANRPKLVKVVEESVKKLIPQSIDTRGMRWDMQKARWVKDYDTKPVKVTTTPPAPAITRSCFELDALIQVVKPSPRAAGTIAATNYAAMVTYVMDHPAATVGDVLANTSYRKQDYAWDLKKGNVR